MIMKMLGKLIFPIILLAGCAADTLSVKFDPQEGDLAATWNRAWVALPWARDIERLGDADLQGGQGREPVPAIIHLHGCTGFGGDERTLAQEFAGAGFAVFAPDSMAREFRPLQCNPDDQTGGYNRFIYHFRLAEVAYALQMIQDLDWVDRDRLYLVGGSEGGVAAALYRGGEFRARIIFQWTCHGAPLVHGLSDTAEPVLSVVNAGDPWYSEVHTHNQTGSCAAFYTHPDSRELLLSEDGLHNVLSDPTVRAAMTDFLIKNTEEAFPGM